jgi:predicted phosphodiesterase
MRLAVLSDVHANLPALEAVLEDMQSFHPDKLLFAGDFTGGPQVEETVRLLRSYSGWMIRGNSDINLLRLADGSAPAAWYTYRQFGLLRWNREHVSAETMEFLRGLPDQIHVGVEGCAPLRMVHGSPRSPYEQIYPDQDPWLLNLALELTAEPVLICGHTHEPWMRQDVARLALNPGAVVGGFNKDNRAVYALLNWQGRRWEVEFRKVNYDHAALRRAFEQSGLLEDGGAIAQAVLLGQERGEDICKEFLAHACHLAGQSGANDCKAIPDPIWEQATASFSW